MVGFETEVTSEQIREIATAAIEAGHARNLKVSLADRTRVDIVCNHIRRELEIPDDTVKKLFWPGREAEWNSIDTVTGYIVYELNYC